jgi:predicted regulator of Ras-like GTPase activity (Roadblock/LC7/MglB family)
MQAAPAPQPVIVAPAAEASVAPETAPANILLDYGLIFGQPEKKSWTINEVIQATGELRGVEGALIADSDGLLMGGSWSGEIAPESVAAFIPQMFRRILEYSIELKLGDPADFILMIENVPLQIFKAGSNFLAVLGKSGENLPKPQLMAVAKRLTQTVK